MNLLLLGSSCRSRRRAAVLAGELRARHVPVQFSSYVARLQIFLRSSILIFPLHPALLSYSIRYANMAIKLEVLPLLLLSVGAAVVAQIFGEYPAGPVFAGTFGVGLMVYLVYWTYIYPFHVSPLRKVPTVPGFPLWGQFFTIIKHEIGVPNREWHLKYGPIIRYFFPFGAERLSIADDDALNHMCIKNPYNYPKPDRAKQWMVRILGEGVLLAEGNPHKQQRKALSPGFSTQSIKALTPVFWRKSLLLSKLWERDMLIEKTRTKTIEILEWLNRTTLDIIGEAGFGADLDSLEHPETPIREAYRLVFAFDISSRLLHGLAAFIPQTKYLPAKMNRDILQSRNIIISKANDIVRQKHQKTHAKDKDIIALLVKDNMKMEAAGEASLSFDTMRNQVMTFLGAGHDSKIESFRKSISKQQLTSSSSNGNRCRLDPSPALDPSRSSRSCQSRGQAILPLPLRSQDPQRHRASFQT